MILENIDIGELKLVLQDTMDGNSVQLFLDGDLICCGQWLNIHQRFCDATIECCFHGAEVKFYGIVKDGYPNTIRVDHFYGGPYVLLRSLMLMNRAHVRGFKVSKEISGIGGNILGRINELFIYYGQYVKEGVCIEIENKFKGDGPFVAVRYGRGYTCPIDMCMIAMPVLKIAEGHNLFNLTVNQVGVGRRLMTLEEIGARSKFMNLIPVEPSNDIYKWDDILKQWYTDGCYGNRSDVVYSTSKPPGYWLKLEEPVYGYDLDGNKLAAPEGYELIEKGGQVNFTIGERCYDLGFSGWGINTCQAAGESNKADVFERVVCYAREIEVAAKGHNASQISETIVGVGDGHRLLSLEEIKALKGHGAIRSSDIEVAFRWSGKIEWVACVNVDERSTYRTKKPEGYYSEIIPLEWSDYPIGGWMRQKRLNDTIWVIWKLRENTISLICSTEPEDRQSIIEVSYTYAGHSCIVWEFSDDFGKTWKSCWKLKNVN